METPSNRWLRVDEEELVGLGDLGSHQGAVHVFDAKSVVAINAALASGRPLLVRGEPGSGKSQLARAAAVQLGWGFVSKTVDVHTEPRDLCWSIDAVARLGDAQAGGREDISEVRYLNPGPLWWAFDGESAYALKDVARIPVLVPYHPTGNWSDARGCVVLIDEIDKADASVPNGLLEALGNGRFGAPGQVTGVAMQRKRPPLVIITTNEERMLPDAFLRRCLVLHMDAPSTADELIARGGAHFPKIEEQVLRQAADLLITARQEVTRRGLAAPGQAEYLDLIRAVAVQEPDDHLALLQQVADFVLYKHPPEESGV